MWLITSDVLKLSAAPDSLGNLMAARVAADQQDGLRLVESLGQVLEEGLRTKSLDMVVAASVFLALRSTSTALKLLAQRLQDFLFERARVSEPDSWLAGLILHTVGSSVFTAEQLDSIKLFEKIPAADLSIDTEQAHQLTVKARTDSALRRALLRKSLAYLKDAEKRGLMSNLVMVAVGQAVPEELVSYFSFLCRHLYRYPHDVSIRLAVLRAVPLVPQSQKRFVRRLLKETEEWLDSEPDNTSVRLVWWAGVAELGDGREAAAALRKIMKWLDALSDRKAAVALERMLRSPLRKLPAVALSGLLSATVEYCGRITITDIPIGLMRALPDAYLQLMHRATGDGYTPLLREVYDLVALWYWENQGTVGPDLPPPGRTPF